MLKSKQRKLESLQYRILTRCIQAYRSTSSYDTHLLSRCLRLCDFLDLTCKKESLRNGSREFGSARLATGLLESSFYSTKFYEYLSSSSNTFQSFFPTQLPDFVMPNQFVTLFLTGKGPFLSFLFQIGACNSPLCVCGLDYETPIHMLMSCPITKPILLDYFDPSYNISSFFSSKDMYINFVKVCALLYHKFLVCRIR